MPFFDWLEKGGIFAQRCVMHLIGIVKFLNFPRIRCRAGYRVCVSVSAPFGHSEKVGKANELVILNHFIIWDWRKVYRSKLA